MIELIEAKELILLKVITVKNVSVATIEFLIRNLNIKILPVMVAMVLQYYVLILAILLLLLSKELIIIILFMALANQT